MFLTLGGLPLNLKKKYIYSLPLVTAVIARVQLAVARIRPHAKDLRHVTSESWSNSLLGGTKGLKSVSNLLKVTHLANSRAEM